jgi:hypothetical protein
MKKRAERKKNAASKLPQLKGTDALAGGDDNYIDFRS